MSVIMNVPSPNPARRQIELLKVRDTITLYPDVCFLQIISDDLIRSTSPMAHEHSTYRQERRVGRHLCDAIRGRQDPTYDQDLEHLQALQQLGWDSRSWMPGWRRHLKWGGAGF